MTITLWLFLRRSLWFGLAAAACWAVLTANSGWGFFALLLPLLLLWQWHYPLPMPALRWRYLLLCGVGGPRSGHGECHAWHYFDG